MNLGTLQVEVDGEPIAPEGGAVWAYDSVDQEIEFAPGHRPQLGARVRVRYWSECR